jgi:hypothetical protein
MTVWVMRAHVGGLSEQLMVGREPSSAMWSRGGRLSAFPRRNFPQPSSAAKVDDVKSCELGIALC